LASVSGGGAQPFGEMEPGRVGVEPAVDGLAAPFFHDAPDGDRGLARRRAEGIAEEIDRILGQREAGAKGSEGIAGIQLAGVGLVAAEMRVYRRTPRRGKAVPDPESYLMSEDEEAGQTGKGTECRGRESNPHTPYGARDFKSPLA